MEVIKMSRWSELYETEINSVDRQTYIDDKLRTKDKIIKLINKYAKNGLVMEMGTGTGILALKIASMGNKVIALDVDKDMINISKKYFLNFFPNSDITYVNKDIREYKTQKKMDVIYSIGVLEHYLDNEIVEIINKQLSLSNYVIFGIPTKYFDENKKMYGNERYLKIKYWRKLIKKTNGKLIEETHYHYLNWYQRIFKISKYFKPYPVHVFVLKKM